VLDARLPVSRREGSMARAARWRTTLKWVSAVLLLGFLGFSSHGVMVRHFWSNDRFLVHNPRIVTNGSLSHDLILRQAGISEGLHAFGIDLRAARQALESLPCVRSATIERSLSGELSISVEERLPAAWLACDAPAVQAFTTDPQKGGCLIDEYGVIFPCTELTPALMKLPVIHVGRLPSVQPGSPADSRSVRSALELMAAGRQSPGGHSLEPVEIHAPNDWSLVVRFSDGVTATFGRDDHAARWERLSRAMEVAAAEDRRLATINLLVRKNVPVTFADSRDSRNEARAGHQRGPPASPGQAAPTTRPAPTSTDIALEEILGGGT
jgi:cell division septal protein FtsQ